MNHLNAYVSNAESAIMMIKNVKVHLASTGMIADHVCMLELGVQQSIRLLWR